MFIFKPFVLLLGLKRHYKFLRFVTSKTGAIILDSCGGKEQHSVILKHSCSIFAFIVHVHALNMGVITW